MAAVKGERLRVEAAMVDGFLVCGWFGVRGIERDVVVDVVFPANVLTFERWYQSEKVVVSRKQVEEVG